jgi:ABC-type transport system involved in multi-copper enzyme maturation permease subunit
LSLRTYFPAFLAVAAILLVAALYLPPLAEVLSFVTMRPGDWLLVACLIGLAAVINEISKGFPLGTSHASGR